MNHKLLLSFGVIIMCLLALFFIQAMQQPATQSDAILPKISPKASTETLPEEIKKCVLADLKGEYTNQIKKGILVIGFKEVPTEATIQEFIDTYPQFALQQQSPTENYELVTFTTNAKDTYDTFKQRCYLKQHPTVAITGFDYLNVPW